MCTAQNGKKLLFATILCIFLEYSQNGVQAKDQLAVEDEDSEEQPEAEKSSVPVFVRSKFNLRVWSTTASSDITDVVENGERTTLKSSLILPYAMLTTERITKDTESTTEEVKQEFTSVVNQLSESETIPEGTTAAPLIRKMPSLPCGEMNGEDMPWIAILEHTNPKGGTRKKTLSKGVLIDDRHVLTTISSIHNSYPFWVVSGIRLGDTPTWAFSEGGKDTNVKKRDVLNIPVKNVFLHEKKDIAVIRLAEKVNITDKIRPACLPPNDRVNYTDMFFHVCKKSKSNYGRFSTKSSLIAVTHLSHKDCQILFKRHQAEIGPKEFCVWDETGDSCTGDLGGPLMVKINGRYHVIGLNSYALAKSKIDSEGLPGVYVRVGAFQRWIQAVLRTEFDDMRS